MLNVESINARRTKGKTILEGFSMNTARHNPVIALSTYDLSSMMINERLKTFTFSFLPFWIKVNNGWLLLITG